MPLLRSRPTREPEHPVLDHRSRRTGRITQCRLGRLILEARNSREAYAERFPAHKIHKEALGVRLAARMTTMSTLAFYTRVWCTFFENALQRELQFRGNFVTTLFTRGFWFVMQLALFDLIYRKVPMINDWSRADYFGFMATVMIVNSLVEMFFMPNCAQFSELIRTGNLDFALVKPIDTQFLISFEKMDLAMISQVAFGVGLLVYSLITTQHVPSAASILLYGLLILSATAFFYSVMVILACTSLFFGRNQSLIDFWFYITVFARYPSTIYSGSPTGEVIRFIFSYILPILLVMTVPARVIMDLPVVPSALTLLVAVTGVVSVVLSRVVFRWSLRFYRSASS